MERQQTARIAHSHHPVTAPLSDGTVRRLLDLACTGRADGGWADGASADDGRVLEVCCGEAPWLLRALTAHPGLRAVGVDTDPERLNRAREAAELLGVARRIGLHHQDARDFRPPEPFQVVLGVGASGVFGGVLSLLAAVGDWLAPGGVAVVGAPFTGRGPDGLVEQVTAAGWVPVQGHISSQEELDAYAWARTGALAAWALDHDDAEVAALAAEQRTAWLADRGTDGFVTLVLRRR
ncbi:SAM-dependent methyltransferase [Kitasatospora sp. McL0602]|uniref:SAM-dependent methyltransferase n=1 Tax=Kitasatospora sp. McL0602 TaxID=3439530 RepID=UPI003F8C561A